MPDPSLTYTRCRPAPRLPARFWLLDSHGRGRQAVASTSRPGRIHRSGRPRPLARGGHDQWGFLQTLATVRVSRILRQPDVATDGGAGGREQPPVGTGGHDTFIMTLLADRTPGSVLETAAAPVQTRLRSGDLATMTPAFVVCVL